jgi:acyl dehydratase
VEPHGPTRSQAGLQLGWTLEDAVPGAILRHPSARTIDQDEHILLAWMTHNAGDLHGDVARAVDGPFGSPVVLGALTTAIVVGLAAPAVPLPEDLPTHFDAVWLRIRLVRPVVPGDTVRAESTIHEVLVEGPGRGGIVRRTITGLDQGGNPVVILDEEIWAPSA